MPSYDFRVLLWTQGQALTRSGIEGAKRGLGTTSRQGGSGWGVRRCSRYAGRAIPRWGAILWRATEGSLERSSKS